MATGTQSLTTFIAKRIIGDNAAQEPSGALLNSGAGRADNSTTGDTWIFLDTIGGTSSPWGIKHSQGDNKIKIIGSNTEGFWVTMNTGNTYILGKVGIGYNPDTSGNTYKLYVNGTTYFNGNTTHNGIDYFANGTTYYINNSGTANLYGLTTNSNTIFKGHTRLNNSKTDCLIYTMYNNNDNYANYFGTTRNNPGDGNLYGDSRFIFLTWSYNSSTKARLDKYEYYILPSVTADRTGNAAYDIRTSKSSAYNVDTATHLSSAPNNTTTFYRGDKTWTNTLIGGLEIKGHIAGDANATGHGLYSGGGYHNAYNNIILHGDASTGTSSIAFVSDKVAADGTVTNINQPSDRAFIQFHAYGVTTYTAEGTAPTLATSGEANVLVIGVGNDAADTVRLQTPSRTGLLHQVAANAYVIPDTNNATGSVGGANGPVYVNGGVITACTTYANATVGKADRWTTDRTFTVGATGKTVNGTGNVSWSMNEIMGSSDSSKFYRGDKTWSNTIVGPFNASSSGTARANINMVTVADQPNDFYLGNNNANKWSITSRASNESYNLNVYSTKSGIGYSTRWEYDTGKFLMLHGAEVSGGYLVISQPDDHRDYGVYGTYKYTKAATIWSMGTSYKIAADGSGLGSLYGAAYAYQDQAYIGSKRLAGGHQFLWCENGRIDVALGSNGVWIKKGGGIYWDPYVESASDASDVSRIIQVASGCAGGTELQIYQANDATDCINLVTPKSIYLNSKEAFNVSDSWLRINENKKFTSGVYFGSSLVRTDGTLRAGAGSSSWTDITAGVVVARIDSGESRVEARNGTHRVYLYCNSNGSSGLYGVRTDGTAYSLLAFGNNSSTGTFYGNCTGSSASCTGNAATSSSCSGNAATATTATKLGTDAGNSNTPVYFSGGKPVATNNKLGAQSTNGYWGMGTAANAFNDWIRTTSAGLIPYQSGGIGSGHCGLGTSSWYFSSGYIDNMYGHLLVLQGATNATMTSGTANPRIVFQEGTGTQPVVLAYTDYDGYRAPAGLKVVGGASATPAWFEVEGHVYAAAVHNAIWNDYAECRKASCEEPGRVIAPDNTGLSHKATKRLMPGCRIISDTWGHIIGESTEAKTPIAVSGRVLAYPYRAKTAYRVGDCVCSAPNGTVDIMTREEIKEWPDRIIGIVNEIPTYDVWEQTEPDGERRTTRVQVKGRIWIDVK